MKRKWDKIRNPTKFIVLFDFYKNNLKIHADKSEIL